MKNNKTFPKENLIDEVKNLSENILRSVKSKGFKYIDLPSVIEANHIVQRSEKTLESLSSLLLIRMEVNCALDLI